MKLLIFLITIITVSSHLRAVEEDYIIWKYNNNSHIENAYFGGEEDEFIIIVGNNSILKISTQDNQLIDSVNLPRGTASSAITNDGKEIYVSIQEKILRYNVYDFNDVDSLTTIPLSGRLDSEYLVHAYRMLKLSKDNKLLTCKYIEANGIERLTQILIYDLEQNIVLKRFDHNKINSNLIDFKIEYENPTFIEQDNKLIFSSKTNSKDSLLSQVFILDYNSDEFDEVMEARNKIHTFTDYHVLNENLINISRSSLPSTRSFNVLDLRDMNIKNYYDFNTIEGNSRPLNPYKIFTNLVMITLNDSFKDEPSFTFLDLDNRKISKFYYALPLRGFNIDMNNSLDKFISYSGAEIYLHNLTKYLVGTSLEDTEDLERFLYPNPTTNNVQIETSCSLTETRIELVNINGTILKNEVIPVTDGLVTFDLSGFPSGSYFVRLNCGEEIRTYNVIKEN